MIKDSGERTEFDTGAVRDCAAGKGRCDLLPLEVVARYYGYTDPSMSREPALDRISCYQDTGNIDLLYGVLRDFVCIAYDDSPETMLLELSVHFEEGGQKYGEYNWQKGIPERCYIDSAIRHYLKWKRGDDDEHHDRAFVWNIVCLIWTVYHEKELMDDDAGKGGDPQGNVAKVSERENDEDGVVRLRRATGE